MLPPVTPSRIRAAKKCIPTDWAKPIMRKAMTVPIWLIKQDGQATAPVRPGGR